MTVDKSRSETENGAGKYHPREDDVIRPSTQRITNDGDAHIVVSNDSVPLVGQADKSKPVEVRGVPKKLLKKARKLAAELGGKVIVRDVQYLQDEKDSQLHAYKVKVEGTWTYHNTCKGVIERLEWAKARKEWEDCQKERSDKSSTSGE